VLYFRLAVPLRFRSILKVSELTTSLHTQERKNAIPAAYKLAGAAKTLFLYLDYAMTEKDDYEIDEDSLRKIIEGIEDGERSVLRKKAQAFSLPALMAIKKKDIEINVLKENYERELEQALKKRELDTYRQLQSVVVTSSTVQKEPVKENTPIKKRSKSPRLSVVRESQHDNLDKTTASANKKTKAAKWWDVFIELVGDKQADNLEQIDIDFYLEEVCFLPSDDNAKEYKGLSYKDQIKLCKKNKSETIAINSFKNGYKTPIKKFVEYGYKEFKSLGFAKITVDALNKYSGNKEAGESEQRNLDIAEVDTLINNDVMNGYINNQSEVHNFWFVMLGLFSGARLNEVCQLHPVNDIRMDEKSGVWFFEVTEDDKDREILKAGEVNQSAKSEAAKRQVPIHKKLIDLGFTDYVMRRRFEGASIIFPFKVRKDGDVVRAGSNAGQEFTKYLKRIGLYDATPKNKVSGYHSLRKTFITEASECVGDIFFKDEDDELQRFMLGNGKISPIVGHETSFRNKAGENVKQGLDYAKRRVKELKKGDISKKKVVVDCLSYDVIFPMPK
jgi:integrase